MKRTRLATIVSNMHKPVDGLLPALLIPENGKKSQKPHSVGDAPHTIANKSTTMAPRILANNPKR